MSSSPSLTELINALKCLPGVGQKSAQRMALYLIERDQVGARRLANATITALEKVKHCKQCRNFSDTDLCEICGNQKRDAASLCIVEAPADVLAVE
ncbi:MAG: recombination protein RecR, partial [Gammaproteobacteria bacterium]